MNINHQIGVNFFSVESNVDAFARGLSDIERRQLPFATALALTRTAQGGKTEVEHLLSRVLDRPTRFTLKGVGTTRATKRNLQATVFVKDIQADYLYWQSEGGTRYPERRAIPVPVGVGLNKYGNMTRNRIRQLRARKDVFSGEVKGVAGLWQRKRNGSVKLLVAYEPRAHYRKRLPFDPVLAGYVSTSFDGQLAKAMREAVDNAK